MVCLADGKMGVKSKDRLPGGLNYCILRDADLFLPIC